MGKNKLQKFADITEFANVFQYPFSVLREKGFDMKGKWGERFFGNDNPIVLELGCGKGEYTVGLARNNKDKNFIGIDIKGARIWSGAKEALETGLANAAFLRTSIELLPYFFDAGEVSEIFPKVGELVGTGAPIMNIAVMEDMWVSFNVREDLLKGLTVGTEFEAYVPALDRDIRLKVYYMKDLGTYAAWKATKTTGQFDLKTFEVKASPVEKVDGLRPGMSVVLEK